MVRFDLMLKKSKINFTIDMLDRDGDNMTIEVTFKESVPYRILKEHIQSGSWGPDKFRYSTSINEDGSAFKLMTFQGDERSIQDILDEILTKVDEDYRQIQKARTNFRKHFKTKFAKKK